MQQTHAPAQGRGWRAAQCEARRLVAARLFRAGRLSQAEIARTLGVSEAAVSQWHTRWQHGGDRRLRARATRAAATKLSPTQWGVLGRILDRGAMASGFDTEQWTLKRIAAVIERRFGVHYHYRYLERPLKAHGFSVQRPASRAKERDERLVAEWLLHTWPALKKKGGPGASHHRPVGRNGSHLSHSDARDLGPARADARGAAREPTA